MSPANPTYKRLTSRAFRLRREKLGFTAEKMAVLCGASSGRVVRKWEAGNNEVPEGTSRFLWLLDCLPEAHRTRIIDILVG